MQTYTNDVVYDTLPVTCQRAVTVLPKSDSLIKNVEETVKMK